MYHYYWGAGGGELGLESTSDFLVASFVAIRFLAWEKKKAPYNFIHNLGENKFKSVYYIFNFKIVIKAGSLYLL